MLFLHLWQVIVTCKTEKDCFWATSLSGCSLFACVKWFWNVKPKRSYFGLLLYNNLFNFVMYVSLFNTAASTWTLATPRTTGESNHDVNDLFSGWRNRCIGWNKNILCDQRMKLWRCILTSCWKSIVTHHSRLHLKSLNTPNDFISFWNNTLWLRSVLVFSTSNQIFSGNFDPVNIILYHIYKKLGFLIHTPAKTKQLAAIPLLCQHTVSSPSIQTKAFFSTGYGGMQNYAAKKCDGTAFARSRCFECNLRMENMISSGEATCLWSLQSVWLLRGNKVGFRPLKQWNCLDAWYPRMEVIQNSSQVFMYREMGLRPVLPF